MTDAIQIRGVTKTFGPKVAVRNLDLTIPQGSLYGFIGPNGAGKTTTIRMIMSIIFPDKGDLEVLGRTSALDSKDQIGYLPEERGVYRKMRVGAFLNFMGRLKGVDALHLDRIVRDWLDRVGLKDCYRKKCEELSKGMQQKVQFIAAAIHKPQLLILDEPFSGLDPVNRRLLRELIMEQHRAGHTVIFSTHAMFEAEQLCDHLFMIHKGDKVLDLPIGEVWRKYDPRTVIIEPMEALHDVDSSSWASLPGVREVQQGGRGFDLRLTDDADPSAVMEAVTRTTRVRRMEIKRPSLEDIFIDLVGGEAAGLRAELEAEHGATPELTEVARA
ncbi:MAG: ATP-binding cassette domain-containing protein [Phycisphaerales bacterium]|nr:ATP-binding cassette domain-containing protein [Phycisphaerales bacterium]